MCYGQMKPIITQILVFLGDLIFYQAFDMNLRLSWCDMFVGGGGGMGI